MLKRRPFLWGRVLGRGCVEKRGAVRHVEEGGCRASLPAVSWGPAVMQGYQPAEAELPARPRQRDKPGFSGHLHVLLPCPEGPPGRECVYLNFGVCCQGDLSRWTGRCLRFWEGTRPNLLLRSPTLAIGGAALRGSLCPCEARALELIQSSSLLLATSLFFMNT